MNSLQNVILMVEDDPYDTVLIQRAMKKAKIGAQIQHVTDGEAAIAYLTGHAPYDDRAAHPLPVLLLLDLQLPRKNGFEVLRWLRSQPVVRRLPVVMLTSSSESPDVSQAYELGANSYLVKPVDTDTLVDMLKKVEVYWLVTNTRPELDADASSGA